MKHGSTKSFSSVQCMYMRTCKAPRGAESRRRPPLMICLPHAACSRLLLSVCPFTIDDTGCPTSQSVSPSKTPSGSERSGHGSPVLPERKAKVKRVRVMAEWSAEPRGAQRHKREPRSALKARGKEERRSVRGARWQNPHLRLQLSSRLRLLI